VVEVWGLQGGNRKYSSAAQNQALSTKCFKKKF
jgi:hypothetical protein